MATEFKTSVASSGGDYTTLSAFEAALQNDLTAATIKVFSISAASSPTIAAGDTVLGQTSLATGVCVLVNAARTQILIKTIAVASFQSGEVVQKTADAAVTVTLSNAGDSPIVVAEVSAYNDTTAFTIDGWTTSATNYIVIRATTAAAHAGYWDTAKFYCSVTNGVFCTVQEEFVRFKQLQFSVTVNDSLHAGIMVGQLSSTSMVRVEQCLFKGAVSGGGGASCHGVLGYDDADGNCVIQIINCVAFDFYNTDFPNGANGRGFGNIFSDMRCYNCTAYNCGIGFFVGGSTFKTTAVNCLSYCDEVNANYIDYSASTNFQNSSNNADTDGTAPGTSPQSNLASTDVDFLSTSSTNANFLAIDSTSACVGTGTDNPLTGVYLDDIRGATRVSVWDIGADEYIAAGGAPSVDEVAPARHIFHR